MSRLASDGECESIGESSYWAGVDGCPAGRERVVKMKSEAVLHCFRQGRIVLKHPFGSLFAFLPWLEAEYYLLLQASSLLADY